MTALPRLTGPLLCALLLAAGGVPSSGEARAVRLWLEGDAEAAVTALAELPPSRERAFNEAVVLLYRGDYDAAERLLLVLRTRHEGWTPALRWLARVEKELGRPAASATALALLKSSEATVRDRLWAARLFAERHDLQRAGDSFRRAVASEDDLYVAWTGLADVETALGHPEAARAARARAEALYPGGPTPLLAAVAPLPARPLRYRAKYLFVPLADVTLAEGAPLEVRGEAARVLTLEARSTAPFFHMDTRLESFLGRDSALLGRRNLSNDSTGARRQTVVDVDPATGAFRVRQVRGGLFEYDVLPPPTPARPHDGLSLLEAARSVARSGTSLSLLRIADSGWKGTFVRRARAERIRWQGKDVDTVLVEIGIASRGTAGLHGALQLWISNDARAIPFRAKMAIAIGAVTLELAPPEPGGTSGGA